MPLIASFCLTILANNAFNVMLNSKGHSGHLCLLPNFAGKDDTLYSVFH